MTVQQFTTRALKSSRLTLPFYNGSQFFMTTLPGFSSLHHFTTRALKSSHLTSPFHNGSQFSMTSPPGLSSFHDFTTRALKSSDFIISLPGFSSIHFTTRVLTQVFMASSPSLSSLMTSPPGLSSLHDYTTRVLKSSWLHKLGS